MDGRDHLMDNTFVERLWRTVWYEDSYFGKYSTVLSLEDGLRIYSVYNNIDFLARSLLYC